MVHYIVNWNAFTTIKILKHYSNKKNGEKMEFKIHNYLEYRKEIIEKAKEKN